MKIKFISYTGVYPCLCEGILTLKINEEKITFGNNCKFDKFWFSSDTCGIDENWKKNNKKPWTIEECELPDFLKPYAKEIESLINANMEWGCCGGCS